MTLTIVRHAWQMMAADWGKTFRLVVLPWLVVIGVFMGFAKMAERQGDMAPFIVLGAPMALVMIACYLWVLVGWHRYVLLGEGPGRFGPAWNGMQILSYLGYAILIGLIVAIPMAILDGLGSSMFGEGGVAAGLFELGSALPIYYLSMRVSLALPSAAVSGTVGIGASWAKTAPLSGTIWKLSAVLIALDLGILLCGLALPSGTISDLFTALAYGVIALLGVSILTTLYGHLIEGRSI